jgi:hypothetical protein
MEFPSHSSEQCTHSTPDELQDAQTKCAETENPPSENQDSTEVLMGFVFRVDFKDDEAITHIMNTFNEAMFNIRVKYPHTEARMGMHKTDGTKLYYSEL